MATNKTTNTIKMFLWLLGIVWATALTILFFAVLLLKIDLVKDIFASTSVVAVVCIVLGTSVGFISGAIVCYLNTAKIVDAKDKKIERLQSDLARVNSNYATVCQSIQEQHAKPQSKTNAQLGARIMSVIANFDKDCSEKEAHLQEEEIAEDSDDSGLA